MGVVYFFYYLVLRVLYIFQIHVLDPVYDLQIFSLSRGVAFSFCYWLIFCFSFKIFLYNLDNNALSDMPFANSFLHLWLICVFCRANVFNLIKSSLTILSSVNHTLLLCACCVQKVIMSKVI